MKAINIFIISLLLLPLATAGQLEYDIIKHQNNKSEFWNYTTSQESGIDFASFNYTDEQIESGLPANCRQYSYYDYRHFKELGYNPLLVQFYTGHNETIGDTTYMYYHSVLQVCDKEQCYIVDSLGYGNLPSYIQALQKFNMGNLEIV